MTTVFLHNITSAYVEVHEQSNSGKPYHVTKIQGVDKSGHEFDVSLVSDAPLGIPATAVPVYESVEDEVESRR
jgi:hypothetical protein